MPLEFIDANGKFRRFRLEQQTAEEYKGKYACVGCAFDIPGDCAMSTDLPEEIDRACVEHTGMVWKEVK